MCVYVRVAGTLERAAAAGNCTADFCCIGYVFVHDFFLVFLCVCACEYKCICKYRYICVYIHIYIYIYMYVHIYIHICIYFFLDINWVTFKCIHIEFARRFKYIHILELHSVVFQIYSCILNLAGDSLQSTGDALNVQIQAAHSDLVELRTALRAKTAALEACHTYISSCHTSWVQSHMNESCHVYVSRVCMRPQQRTALYAYTSESFIHDMAHSCA